jgi:hypothetical protein
MEELTENYKEKYEEVLLKLEKANNTIKMLKNRIKEFETESNNDSDVDYDDSDIDDIEDDDSDNTKIVEDDDDYSEELITRIREKMETFYDVKKFPLEPVYTIEEVIECEKRIGFKLPIHLKNYLTKISREFRYNMSGFREVIKLDNIDSFTQDIYLNGMSCSDNKKIYIQGERKNKIYSWVRTNTFCERPRKIFNNFKEFVKCTLSLYNIP